MKKLSINEITELPQHDLDTYLGISGHPGGMEASDKLIKLLKVNNKQHILDAGCGIGTTSFYIAEKYGCKVTGIDFSNFATDRANNKRKKSFERNQLEFLVVNVESLPFRDEFFDRIIVENVLSLIGDKKTAIEELMRITKTGGIIGINDYFWFKKPPSLTYDKETGEIISESKIYKTKIYVFPTLSEWKDLLSNAGFSDVKYYESPKKTDNNISIKNKISRLRILLKILYLSCRKKELRKRFMMAAKHQKIFKEGTKIGFGLFICKK